MGEPVARLDIQGDLPQLSVMYKAEHLIVSYYRVCPIAGH
jgi:hypothetical protein